MAPNDIDTLGDMMTDDNGRLLVLGGHGNSGSFLSGFGHPRIETYANSDGWFDDISDGPVMARLVMMEERVQKLRYIDVEYPAWVLVGYPRYAPEVLDMITLEDVVEDMSIREFAYRTDMFGTAGTFDAPQKIDPTDTQALLHWKAGPVEWNPAYRPSSSNRIFRTTSRAGAHSTLIACAFRPASRRVHWRERKVVRKTIMSADGCLRQRWSRA
jgi:hypothetical protein